MGEAARRKAQIEALKARNRLWQESLQPIEQTIAIAAQRAYDRIVVDLDMTEGCYHLAFFLEEYLRRHHNIKLRIVVGWVNDGQWHGGTSHAWLEYQDKKIDISLHSTSYPDAQPSGDLIILDHVVKRGAVTYQYWPALPEEARRAFERMEEDPDLAAVIRHKAEEHARMLEFSTMPNGAEEYLRGAPPEGSYAALEQRMKS